MNDLEAWLTLNGVPGVGPARFRALLGRFGSPQAVLEAKVKDLLSVPGVDERTAQAIGLNQDPQFVHNQLELIEKHGVRVVTYRDEEYPENLKGIYDAPPLLFLRGELTEKDKYAVAIVGSRIPSEYGKLMAERLGGELAERGITIVSGMARGIDSVGHRGCLGRGGRTIAVLGCGIDVVYPAENRRLMEEIIESGAVVSEFPMETKPEGPHFPRRNRIISGLSLGVIIVEAGEKSGALFTAEFALNQNREVFAVPGQVTSMRSRGTNLLIKEGAKLVVSVEDVLEELAPWLDRPLGPGPTIMPEIRLSEEEKRIYDALSDTPAHIDAIARQTQFSTSKALTLLLSMELNGAVKQLSGKMFIRA
ncbi:MAG: DNA-processing protein DprA [bacterium]